jgi:hypothetical protein
MNAKSVKRTFGLAAAAVGGSAAMMLAPAVANAATAHPAHAQTVSNVSRASGGWSSGRGLWGGWSSHWGRWGGGSSGGGRWGHWSSHWGR